MLTIGWVACTGSLGMGAGLLGLAMFAWQFPHFNSLAYSLQSDYSQAGYRMLSVVDPAHNALVALRYSAALIPISVAFYASGVASAWFLLDSTLMNGYMAWKAWLFWKGSSASSARALFFASLVHLPVYFGLLVFHSF